MKLSYYIALAMLLLTGGCGDNYDEANPIVGKWQEVACGSWYYPELPTSSNIIEFRPDGTYYGPYSFSAHMDDGEPSQYWISSDSLYIHRESDEIQYYDYIYRYTFTGKNQLHAEYIYGILPLLMDTPTFFTFKRIK